MSDNQMIELQEILRNFEHECFMLRTEASDTHAKDDVVRMSYKRILDEFTKRIADTLGRIRYEKDELERFAKRVEDAVNNCEELTLFEHDYIPLPVDADGVPIRPGDILEYNYGDDISGKRTVTALIYDGDRSMGLDGGIWDFEFEDGINGYSDSRDVNCMSDFYECNRHVKPRTLEDVLSDCCNEWNQHCGKNWEQGVYAKYAAEIRELLGGDTK